MRVLPMLALAGALLFAPAMTAQAQALDGGRLKSMAEGLGYTANVLSEPGDALQFEVTVEADGYTTPVLLEISSSGRFIWASANLGDDEVDGDLAIEFLYLNAEIQPSSFWITEDGFLKIGMSIDNRQVTPDYLQFVIQKIAADVVQTADYWEVIPEDGQ